MLKILLPDGFQLMTVLMGLVNSLLSKADKRETEIVARIRAVDTLYIKIVILMMPF